MSIDESKFNKEVLTYQITIEQTNALLNALGQLPFVVAAPHIDLIHKQGGKQVEQILANHKDEEPTDEQELPS
jgi:hypothetical protein